MGPKKLTNILFWQIYQGLLGYSCRNIYQELGPLADPTRHLLKAYRSPSLNPSLWASWSAGKKRPMEVFFSFLQDFVYGKVGLIWAMLICASQSMNPAKNSAQILLDCPNRPLVGTNALDDLYKIQIRSEILMIHYDNVAQLTSNSRKAKVQGSLVFITFISVH